MSVTHKATKSFKGATSKRGLKQRSTATAGAGYADHPLIKAFTTMESAEKLRQARKLERAGAMCEGVLKQYPDYVAAHHTMGLIQADRGQYDRALDHLHRATMLNPRDFKTLTALSGVYLKLGSNLMATRTLEQAQEISPNDANILATLGEIYREEKEYELSKEAYESVLKIDPTFAVAEIGLAHNLVHIGHLTEAAEIFERKVREGSRSIGLLYMLAQLPSSLVSVDVLALLEEVRPPSRKSAKDEFQRSLAFAKASALDKLGNYEEAWEQVCIARSFDEADNKAMHEKLRERHGHLLELARSNKIDHRSESGSSNSSESPISLFIAGPSRSGKTSLERLVGSLPDVKRGFENPIVENAVRLAFQTAGFPTRSRLIELPPPLGKSFREFYTEELHERAGTSKVLTNTLPVRNEDALRAAAEIPNSRFVFVKRDMDDLTIRIFMRNYARGNYYASDLSNIRDYLSWCHEMIDSMAERMPNLCRVIHYEEMVADPSNALAEVAELCDLDLSGDTLPDIGDDRGCGTHYRGYIENLLGI